MIALCANHHAQADAFTKDQIRQLKTSSREGVSSNFQWRRKHTVFVCGGNYAYNCETMLRIHGFDIIFFEKDENSFDTLSLNIYDKCLNPVFTMRKNDWLSRADVDDIEAFPSARKLRMHSNVRGVKVKIEFKDRLHLDKGEIEKCRQLGIPDDENVVFCFFDGEFLMPAPVIFRKNGIFFNGAKLFENTISNSKIGINIS